MPGETILILGGTGEAREIAAALIDAGYRTITSLAGVTRAPMLPPGEVRRGGFGGTAGLAAFIKQRGIAAIVDGTHPFARQISRHAISAAGDCEIACLRFERPAWEAGPGDEWISVASTDEAAAVLPAGARVLLTIGRKEVAPFLARADLGGVLRAIEKPPLEVPAGWTMMLERPPFSVDHEMALITRFAITHLVCKNAGGAATQAKLVAAREKKIPVVIVARSLASERASFYTTGEIVAALGRELCP